MRLGGLLLLACIVTRRSRDIEIASHLLIIGIMLTSDTNGDA
jgi:hypothetical protein